MVRSRRPLPKPKVTPLLQRIRAFCLALPEVKETASWGHPNFRAGKRTFVTFERIDDQDTVALRLHPFEVDDLLKQRGFVRTPYGQGKWVSLVVSSRPKWVMIESLLLQSYRLVALKRMIGALGER
jgi:predicted DNA-binding protein (MmcQ/YjbR family)